VDTQCRRFSFLRRGQKLGTAFGVFLERQREHEKKLVSTVDVQPAVQVMREFDCFSGIAAMARQGWQGDGVRA
jgi:hypothetical protein